MPLLVLLFIVVPIVELYVLIQVGQAIGILPTIALLILDSMLGAWLMKREGARAWRAFQAAVNERRLPHREVADGFLVLLGGAFLLTPGFLTDAIGLVLLLPPTRAGVRRILLATFGKRFVLVNLAADAAKERRRPARTGDVIEGEVLPRAENSRSEFSDPA